MNVNIKYKTYSCVIEPGEELPCHPDDIINTERINTGLAIWWCKKVKENE